MTRFKALLDDKEILTFIVLTLVAGLIYLPFVGQFGYFNDDWYLMFAAGAKGAFVFRDIFSIDRPLRALVMIPAYLLFGSNPLGYNLSAFAFRLASAFGFLWMLRFFWPQQRTSNFLMALLFLIYPGFLSQFNGIDYQSQMVSLAVAVLSLTLTLKAIRAEKIVIKLILYMIAGMLSWLYIGLVEYFIGFEIIRLAGVILLTVRERRPAARQVIQIIRQYLPALIMLLPFLGWRLFVFESERSATDVGMQLGQIVQSPLTTGLKWLITLMGDTLDVVVLAWGQPLSSRFSWIWSRTLLLEGFAIGIISVALVRFVWRQLEFVQDHNVTNWRFEALWFGFVSVIAGLVPIILVNRSVDFIFYSRYTLAASYGAVILIVSIIYYLENSTLRRVLISVMVLVAALTHFANGQMAVQVTKAMRDFWWQVSWRVPQLERNTTLIANYAVGATEEDYFVWGPANLIYYPKGTRDEYVQPGVYAALLNQNTMLKTLLNEGQEYDNRRTIRTYKNYRKLLVLTQPTENSCVHVIDGQQPEYSYYENPLIRIMGSHSNLDFILAEDPGILPPQVVFGPEPEREWCFYYQKASLARQRNDWDEISLLASQVDSLDLEPKDLIEWMPFIQAYAIGGEVSRLSEIAEPFASDLYSTQQVCQILGGMPELSEPTMLTVSQLFCQKKQK
jgi:hypothetical protein